MNIELGACPGPKIFVEYAPNRTTAVLSVLVQSYNFQAEERIPVMAIYHSLTHVIAGLLW